MTTTRTKKKTTAIVTVQHQPPAPAQSDLERFIAALERNALNPKVDVRKMQALLDMQERVINRNAELAYNNAMCDAQAEMDPIARNHYNEHTKSWFSKLEDIDKEIRPIYTKHGFSLSSTSETLPSGEKKIKTKVFHRGGHSEWHELDGALDMTGAKGTANKTSVQGLGSTVSYLRRYLTCMIFNVILYNEDNDGNKTSKPTPKGDDFNTRVHQDANMKSAMPSEPEKWDGKTLYLDGIVQEGNFKNAKIAGQYLFDFMSRAPKKETRIRMIADNTLLIKELAAAELEDEIAQLHALADKGE